MEEHNHLCDHPTCYSTENDCTMYRVESRHGDGAFTVCGEHLIERDVERAEVIGTIKTAAAAVNQEILSGLQQ